MTVWTRSKAIAAVQAFVDRRGYQPVSREAGPRYGLPGYDVAVRLFGSWNEMIEAAGLRPYPPRSSAQAKTLAYRDRHPEEAGRA